MTLLEQLQSEYPGFADARKKWAETMRVTEGCKSNECQKAAITSTVELYKTIVNVLEDLNARSRDAVTETQKHISTWNEAMDYKKTHTSIGNTMRGSDSNEYAVKIAKASMHRDRLAESERLQTLASEMQRLSRIVYAEAERLIGPEAMDQARARRRA